MNRLAFLAVTMLLSGCATYDAGDAYIGGCLNWAPQYIGKYERRMDVLPEHVLIQISPDHAKALLSLTPLPVNDAKHCWYRIVRTGGIALHTSTQSFDFELRDGSWVLTQTYDVVTVD